MTINSKELTKKFYRINKVKFGDKTSIHENTLTLRETIQSEAMKVSDLISHVTIHLIGPQDHDFFCNTILDVQVIATKEKGEVGEGITGVLDGVVMVLTGTAENGLQIGEFGSSEGNLPDSICWNKPGSPDLEDFLIVCDVKIKSEAVMTREGPLAVHRAAEVINNEVRQALNSYKDNLSYESINLKAVRDKSKKKVVIVKEIMGQGAMHDNIIMPLEPIGIRGGKCNVDMGNIPIVMSPLEVLDGGIHALTCVGPSTKETSRHYWREPLIIEAMKDEEIDLCGVIFIGSPQINIQKHYVSKRLGRLVESMDVEGVIITTEGFGNNHIDFACHHEEMGIRNIHTVGVGFFARQGALVVGNDYMKNLIELNKSDKGIETNKLAENTLCKEDAIRALEMLKAVMSGVKIKQPLKRWNPQIRLNNIDLIKKMKNADINN